MDLLPAVFHELQAGRLPSFEILSLLLTRFIGYGLTLSACFIKIPQIFRIARNKSAEGLSISAFEMELFICAIHTSYGFAFGLHSSLYGEALAVLAQMTVLVSFIYYFSGVSKWRPIIIFSLLVSWAVYVISGIASILVVKVAFLLNQFLFIWARILQISKTAKEKNVKQLSLGSYGPSTIGKAVRVMTSIKEQAWAYTGAHTLGFVMNLIMVIQILYYQRQTKSVNHKKTE